MPVQDDSSIPAKLGRYRIVAELGRGAMGTVYHGIDETIERPVALKTLNAELPGEILSEVRERFLREAKSAGQLNHPNVVTIYEFGQDGDTAFIAMEFLSGKSLQAVIREGRLPFATIADLVAQIAEGLDYAHRAGVVHRDIKPANIMVSPHGMAKLTDFGIARLHSSSMTQTGAMLGSPKYMSPEQVLGQPADGRADIFSLGVVLYEMIAARTPFETPDATVFSLMQRIVTVPHDPVLQLVPDAPPAFEWILSKALAKRPEQRYQRAAEFANDLRNFRTLSATGVNGQNTSADKTVLLSREQPAPAATIPTPAPMMQATPAASTLTSASSIAFEKTIATHPGGVPLADTLIDKPAAAPLLEDFDTLGSNLDEMQRKFLEEEARAMAAMRRAASKSKDWDSMAGSIAPATEPAPMASSPAAGGAAETPARKSAVFSLLRQQAAPKFKEQQAAQGVAQVAAWLALDRKARAGYAFLTDFMREANDANPQFAGKHAILYYGDCPPLFLTDGLVNMRLRRIEDGNKIVEIVDHMMVSYKLASTEKRRVTVNHLEYPKLRELLEQYEMPFTHTETRGDFNQIIRAVVEVDMKFTCAITARVDYENQAFELASRNVGALGRRRYRVPAAQFNDEWFEELSKVILGYPSPAFEQFAVAT